MSGTRLELEVGWQTRGPAIVAVCVLTTLLALVVGLRLGPLPALIVLLSAALFAMSRTQWAALEGPSLLLRDAGSRYVFRALAARQPARLVYRRAPLPWCRLALARRGDELALVISGPTPAHPTLRCITMWMIVHGRRRTRIDPRLLDALAAMPEHEPSRRPHNASHA